MVAPSVPAGSGEGNRSGARKTASSRTAWSKSGASSSAASKSTTGDGSNDAAAGAKGSVSSGSGKQNGKRPAAGTAAGANKKANDGAVLKKSTLIVQCPRCNVNVIVPDVKVFQCGKCGQFMTIEKQPSANGSSKKPPEKTGDSKEDAPGETNNVE